MKKGHVSFALPAFAYRSAVSAMIDSSPAPDFFVACLCAAWCDTCREYRAGFEALAAQFPQAEFRWVDIEDEADRLGDEIDVENFPTLLIQRDDQVLFFGVMLPQHGLLKRLLESFATQSPDESRRYAAATPERAAWQRHAALRTRFV